MDITGGLFLIPSLVTIATNKDDWMVNIQVIGVQKSSGILFLLYLLSVTMWNSNASWENTSGWEQSTCEQTRSHANRLHATITIFTCVYTPVCTPLVSVFLYCPRHLYRYAFVRDASGHVDVYAMKHLVKRVHDRSSAGGSPGRVSNVVIVFYFALSTYDLIVHGAF